MLCSCRMQWVARHKPADVTRSFPAAFSTGFSAQPQECCTALKLNSFLLLLQGSWRSGRPCLPAHNLALGATSQRLGLAAHCGLDSLAPCWG